MTAISHQQLADAVVMVTCMSPAEKEALADMVRASHSNLFYSVLVPKRYGASFVEIEVVLNPLFVLFEAKTAGGRVCPLVSGNLQER